VIKESYIAGQNFAFAKFAKLRGDVQLQAHQQEVLDALEEQDALLLYHGLGSGKSLSSIAATEGMNTDVVVPASLRENYKKELAKFTTTPGKRNVMSYESASKGIKPQDALVVDEAHRLGNSGTSRTKAMLELAPNYKKRILLTGTPIRNHPHELAPLLRMLDPKNRDLPLDPTGFRQEFVEEEKIDPGFFRRIFLGMKPGILEKAKNLGVIEKAFKGKVHHYQPDQDNFPERRDQLVEVPMDQEHLDIYNTVIEKANPALARKIRSNFPLSKQETGKLNAFLTAPRIAVNSPEAYGGTKPSSKFLRAFDDFQRASKKNPGHKAITYSNFIEGGVEPYSRLLSKAKVPYGVFQGGLSDKARKQLVEDYNTGKIKNLLITGAGSEGLDLKGTRAIQLLEPHWNDPRLEQAIGRGIRFGSHTHLPEEDRNVDVLRYLATIPKSFTQRLFGSDPDTSVDEYLYNLSKKKDALNQQFLKTLR